MFYTETKRQAKNGKKMFSQHKSKPGLCIVVAMLVRRSVVVVHVLIPS